MVATKCRNLLAAIDAARGRRFTAPILPFAICDARKGGHVSLPPLLPWDGVALSYPTDATICRTGTAVAPCDNGAAADRLAGVRISDAGGAASSCPNFGRLPHVSCYKMLLRRDETDFASMARGYPRGSGGIGDTGKGSGNLRLFEVFAPVRQAPYIADNFGNIASCPDGGHLPALSAAPGWACGGVYSSGVPFSSGVGISPWRAPSLSSSFFSMRMHRNSV